MARSSGIAHIGSHENTKGDDAGLPPGTGELHSLGMRLRREGELPVGQAVRILRGQCLSGLLLIPVPG